MCRSFVGVFDALSRLLVLLFQRYDLRKKLQPEQSRLAALPAENDRLAILSFDVLTDVGFQNLIADAELTGASQQFFLM